MQSLIDYFRTSFLGGYLLVCIVTAVIGTLAYIFFSRRIKNKFPFLLLVTLGFSFLGLTVGILVGNSREAAVNSTISASLTFLGALVVYIFSKSEKSYYERVSGISTQPAIVLLSLIAFPLTLLYGSVIGSSHRFTVEKYQEDMSLYNQMQLKDYESQLRLFEDSTRVLLEIYKHSVLKKDSMLNVAQDSSGK